VALCDNFFFSRNKQTNLFNFAWLYRVNLMRTFFLEEVDRRATVSKAGFLKNKRLANLILS
jgi:hypothetical protein